MQNNIQAVLIFAARLKSMRERRILSTIHCRAGETTATVSTGLHARQATGLTVAEREESFTRTESVARWSREGRAAYEAEREALLFDLFSFFLFERCRECRL